MQSWVQGNDIEMYSTRNEGKSFVAEMLFELWKIKSANMWPQYEKVYIDKLVNVVNKYNNTYYETIKRKSIDVKTSKYTDFHFEKDDKEPK